MGIFTFTIFTNDEFVSIAGQPCLSYLCGTLLVGSPPPLSPPFHPTACFCLNLSFKCCISVHFIPPLTPQVCNFCLLSFLTFQANISSLGEGWDQCVWFYSWGSFTKFLWSSTGVHDRHNKVTKWTSWGWAGPSSAQAGTGLYFNYR